MIIKILKACYTIKWYILSVVCLFILARLQSCYISGTYIYVFLLNIPAILIPYLVLWKLDALRYYNRALAICVFGVWFGYYFINYTIIKDEKAFMTDDIEVYKYNPSGKKVVLIADIEEISWTSHPPRKLIGFTRYMATL